MRKINAKLFLGLLVGAIVCTGAVFAVHHFQYGRIADSLLKQARRAEEQGQVKRQARYLKRYLEFNGKDLDEKAHLAKLWAGDTFADSLRERRKAMRLLDEVLTKGDDNAELRRLLVKVALEIRQTKMARNHLEKLLTAKFLKSPPKLEDVEQTPDPARGEAEGYAGQLLETENQPAKALLCYYLAVRHAPEIQDNYIALAHLLRKLDKDYADRAVKNQAEANRILDELVKNNRVSHEAYLARWHYRREFNLIDLSNGASRGGEKRKTVVKVMLKEAAGDVAEARQRAPESVEALLAAADLERLEGQAVFSGPGTDEEKEKGRKEHCDKALSYLNQGLKLHAKGGRQATADSTQYRLLWHKANLLLDDVERFDLANNGEAAAKNSAQRQEWVADATEAVEQIRKTRSEPAVADYLKGRLLLQEQRWAEAVTLFEQVRPKLGTQADLAGQINRCLGQCYEQLRQHNQMYNAYERLLQTEPNSIAARLGMAQAEGELGHIDQAAEIFQKLAQAKQMPAKVWLDYARLEIRRRAMRSKPNWEHVDELLKLAGEANPKAVEVQLLTAQMWMVRREAPDKNPDMDQARKVLEHAQEDKKDSAELWTARVYLELKADKAEVAQEILDEAKKALGDRVVLLRLAEANLLASKNEKGAEEAITRLASDADSFPKEDERAGLLNGLANIQLFLKNTAAARELLQRMAKLPNRKNDLSLKMLLFDLAIKLDDEAGQRQALEDIQAVEGNQGLFHRYGEALRLIWRAKNASDDERRKFLGEARAHLDRVHSLRSTWPPEYLARAEIARQDGPKKEDLIRNLRKAVELGETSPGVIGELAAMLYNDGHFDEANKVLKHVRDPLLVNSDLGRLKGIVALNRNDMQTARELLEKNRTPESSTDYRSLLYEGRMLAEMNEPGMKEEAEKKLRKALELAKDEPAPYLALVQLYARQNRKKDADAILEEARQKLQKLPPAQVKLILGQCNEILGRKAKSQALYKEALNGHRQDAAIVRRVAGSYWNAGQLVEAEPLLRDIVEKKVKDPSAEDVNWARWHLALVLASGTDYGRFREAIELVGLQLDNNGQLIRNAKRERDDGTDTRRFQARVLASQSGHRQFRQRAREMLEELERNNALLPDDRFILAMLYETENAWPKAKVILAQLASPKDKAPRHLAYYVQMLIEHKEFAEAKKQVYQLEELETQRGSEKNAFAAIELQARLLEEDGTKNGREKALQLLEDHIQRKTAQPEEVLFLLNAMRRQKKFTEAFDRCLKTWEEKKEEKKCKPEVIGGASVAVLRGMQINGTPATREQVLLIEDKLKEALKDNPKSVVLMLHLAELYDQRGDWQEAELMYRQVLRPENEPKNIVALNNLAWLLAQHASEADKVREALTRIEAAVNGIGRRADLIDTRGLVYLRLNQDSAALADFRDAVADMPTPAHLFHLARAHYKAQDKTNAAKVLKQAKDNGLQVSALHPVEQKDYKRLLEELKIN